MPKNFTIDKKLGKVIIDVDFNSKGTPSSTGKSLILATSNGFVYDEEGIGVSFNVIRREPKKPNQSRLREK